MRLTKQGVRDLNGMAAPVRTETRFLPDSVVQQLCEHGWRCDDWGEWDVCKYCELRDACAHHLSPEEVAERDFRARIRRAREERAARRGDQVVVKRGFPEDDPAGGAL